MKTDSGFRPFIALLWSLAKVKAVAAILGSAVWVAIYFSPLDHTPVGPKAAITGIVFGLMGAAFWYARYVRSFKEQAENVRKA